MAGPLDLATNLGDILGNQANLQADQTTDAYNQKRRKTVGQLGANGRLMSGVSNYDLGNLDAAQGQDVSGAYSGLAGALGGIPAEDMLDTNNYGRQMSLAELIGRLNKPSKLQEALGALGAAGQTAGTIAAFL